MQKKKIFTVLPYFLSFVSILLIWCFFSKIINASLILPPPSVVIKSFFNIVVKAIFWKNFTATILRVFISFLISVFLGTIIGFLCGLSEFTRKYFELPLTIIRTTPVIAIILVAYFWFKSDFVPIFVTVLMTLPIMITSITTGFMNADKKLLQMSKVFNYSKKEEIKYIKIPCCISYFFSGAVSCFGLSWKVVAAGEVICLPKFAIGTLLQKSQIHLETSEVIAQTLILVIVSFLIEKIFSLIVKKVVKDE